MWFCLKIFWRFLRSFTQARLGDLRRDFKICFKNCFEISFETSAQAGLRHLSRDVIFSEFFFWIFLKIFWDLLRRDQVTKRFATQFWNKVWKDLKFSEKFVGLSNMYFWAIQLYTFLTNSITSLGHNTVVWCHHSVGAVGDNDVPGASQVKT